MNKSHLKSLVFRSQNFGLPDPPKTADNRVINLFRALEATWVEWSSLVDAADTIGADTTLPPDLSKVRIKRLVDSRVAKTAERILKSVGEAEKEMRRIESNFETALKPRSAADEMRRHSLRQSLNSMDANKRTETIRNAIRENDLGIIDAVASGRAFESGAMPLHFKECSQKFRELTSPADFHAQQGMKEGIERLQFAASNFMRAAQSELVACDAGAVESRHEAARTAENAEGDHVA